MSGDTKKHGRPPFRPTPEQRALVVALIGAGLGVAEVASNVVNPATGKPISHMTLRAKFRAELEHGQARFKGFVAGRFAQLVRSRDEKVATANVQFAMRARLGWRETNRTELTGADGGPLQVGVDVMSRDEVGAKVWRALAPFLAKRISAALPALPAGTLPPRGIAPEVAWELISKSNDKPWEQLRVWSAWNARNAGLTPPDDCLENTAVPAVTAPLEGSAGASSASGCIRLHPREPGAG